MSSDVLCVSSNVLCVTSKSLTVLVFRSVDHLELASVFSVRESSRFI